MKKIIFMVLALFLIGCDEEAAKQTQKAKPQEAVKELKAQAPKEVTITKTIAPAPLKSGADIYKACIGCHGANAEKPALGKSQIIKSWSSEKIAQALNGYKNATYGGAMKGVMLGQVSKLNAADIKLVSDYISKL